ncbi:FAD-dependent oxidoreductase [Corticibacterium sp. UT-5YL-CI-8]|nr:FAD-dependent oxidoreductase [Tianweitania sp. UT-5YL-CI-8]
MNNGVVIVGTGHAGVQAAASLREEGFDGPVILVGDETDLPYHKPPLSKTFIKDAAARPQPLRGDAFYETNRIDLRLGHRAERIDLSTRRLVLAEGAALPFDRLILATGSRPRALRLEGSDLDGVLSLRSIADARRIREASGQVEEVVVLGGGFIGLEIAATLSLSGRKVAVIEAQDRLIGRAVAPVISEHVRLRLGGLGVRILLNTTLDRLDGDNGAVSAAVTSTGERLPAQMVIVGIGVVPNVELAEAAGLSIANGIRVDPHMRSSVPEILAIGDNASYRHWFSAADVRLESVQNATDQARLAARTILGHESAYEAVPWFWSDIGDMKLQMVGLTGGSSRQVVSGDPAENKFAVHHYLGDRLIGVETVNRPADHMLGRKLIGLGFSLPPDIAASGTEAVKVALAEWQQAQAG